MIHETKTLELAEIARRYQQGFRTTMSERAQLVVKLIAKRPLDGASVALEGIRKMLEGTR